MRKEIKNNEYDENKGLNMPVFVTSKDLFDILRERVRLFYLPDVTAILYRYLKCDSVNIISKDLYVGVWKYMTDKGEFYGADGKAFARSSDRRFLLIMKGNGLFINTPEFQLKALKGIKLTDNQVISKGCIQPQEGSNKDEQIYFYTVGKHIYVSKLEIPRTKVKNWSAKNLRRYLISVAHEERKENIKKEAEKKWGVRFTDLDWEDFKLRYREHKSAQVESKGKGYIERFVVAGSTSQKALRAVGWEFYERCEMKEPAEEREQVYVVVQFKSVGGSLYKCCIVDKNLKTIKEVCRLRLNPQTYKDPQWIRTIFLGSVFYIGDSRVLKYLQKSPEDINTELKDIPYFKWAFNEVLKKRIDFIFRWKNANLY
jgi:hypothetical protein